MFAKPENQFQDKIALNWDQSG